MDAIRNLIRIVFVALVLMGLSFQIYAQEVIQDFYREAGPSQNRVYTDQHPNESIDPFNGSLQFHITDMVVPGNGGFDLKISRSYSSSQINADALTGAPDSPGSVALTSTLGVGWTMHFGRVLKRVSSDICLNAFAGTVADNPVFELPDGKRQLLAYTGGSNPTLLSVERWRVECPAPGTVSVFSPDGVRYDMTKLYNVTTTLQAVWAYYTTRITDKNGNFADIRYSSSSKPEILGVTTSDGRVVNFSYFDSGLQTSRLSSISTPSGTFSFNYALSPDVAGLYFLTSVSTPVGTVWNYSYNAYLGPFTPGSFLLNRIQYPGGAAINYTYGYVYFDTVSNPSYRSTAIFSKNSSDGGSWNYSYTPGHPGVYDSTTVVDPAGISTVYQHYGASTVANGSVWKIGLLATKSVGGLLSESYNWNSQVISFENNYRPGQFVSLVDAGAVNAPVLSGKTIIKDGVIYSTSFSNFDGYGNPQTIVESGPNGGSRSTTVTYYTNPTLWVIKQKQNEIFAGSSIQRTFDTKGNMTSYNEDGVVNSYAYDAQGNISSVTRPRGLITTLSSYKRGIPQLELQPESITISRAVDLAGNVTSETDGEGHTKSYTYDGLNRLRSIVYPSGSGTAITYTPTNKTATRGGLVESVNYDGFGRPINVNLAGVTTSYRYDSLGRMIFSSNPGSALGVSYQYDALSRVSRITNADTTLRHLRTAAWLRQAMARWRQQSARRTSGLRRLLKYLKLMATQM